MQSHDLTAGKRAFVNFTRNLVTTEIPTLFSRESLVIELIEAIEPDAEFLESCAKLKEQGYSFALDDFILSEAHPALIELADLIKVDFRSTSLQERHQVVSRHGRPGLSFVAEKIETMEELEEARHLGYKYYQGFFFSRPEVLKGKDIKMLRGNYLRLLAELAKVEPDFARMTNIIEADLAMSYKLLRLINTVGHYPVDRITNIRAALVRLGYREIIKWAALLMVQELASDKPDALIRQSLVRGKMAEGLAGSFGMKQQKEDLFLVGLFSMLDAIMNHPMDALVGELPLSPAILDTLLGRESRYCRVLSMVKLYEAARWDAFEQSCRENDVQSTVVSEMYLDAVEWADSIE
jgi:EAL and modified HD-GYP domain-containing signal transduction protein